MTNIARDAYFGKDGRKDMERVGIVGELTKGWRAELEQRGFVLDFLRRVEAAVSKAKY
jgi:hypothetical protein